jgi:hypothetical protein
MFLRWGWGCGWRGEKRRRRRRRRRVGVLYGGGGGRWWWVVGRGRVWVGGMSDGVVGVGVGVGGGGDLGWYAWDWGGDEDWDVTLGWSGVFSHDMRFSFSRGH